MTTSGDTKYTEVQQTHYDGCWKDRTHYACALREIEQLRKALRSSCDEQRQLFRDEANMPCEAAVDNEVLRGLLRELLPLDVFDVRSEKEQNLLRRIREALGND